jgi:hypothetical protein
VSRVSWQISAACSFQSEASRVRCWRAGCFGQFDSISIFSISIFDLIQAAHLSEATKRRSRCGAVRGCPVLSSHCSPGLAPQVGQRTSRGCSFLTFIEAW